MNTFSKNQIEKEYHSVYGSNPLAKPEDQHDSSWTKDTLDEFYNNNRRITFKLCWPIINENPFVDYCAFIQFPAKWLASCVRWNREERFFPKLKKFEKNLVFKNYEDYKSQEHAAESCYRYLLRHDFEKKYLGKCCYLMTKYKNLCRLSIPHDERFMIILNVKSHFVNPYVDLVNELVPDFKNKMESILPMCREKLNCIADIEKTTENQLSRKDVLWDFFSSKPFNKKLSAEFKAWFKQNKIIQYASIGTIDGIPLARYEKEMGKRLLISYDEFAFFIESTHQQNQRKKLEGIFGEVNFTISVYEKLIELTVPIGDQFLLSVGILHDDFSRERFFSSEMNQLFESIEKKNWSEILANF